MAKKNNPRADDHYSLRAKKEGYPARSVYKLIEIQKKFRVFDRKSPVLDIGAAPGSWSLYVLRELGGKGFLTAVDLKPLDIKTDAGNFMFLEGDAFAGENIQRIMEKGPYRTVLSDAAPATTGNRSVDTSRSFGLAEAVLDLAEKVLLPGGNLVIKIFQGGDEKTIMERMKKTFTSVKPFRPDAVRKTSFETFLIGTGRKGAPESASGEDAGDE